jgi:uncharacterized protein (DUF433 family)
MSLAFEAVVVPLRSDEHGAVRVGDSRVLLDVVIREFTRGADPESIAHAYPTLDVADVYAVVAYYLRHRDEVDTYLRRRQEEAAALRREIEAQRPGRDTLRERLLARRGATGQGNAAPGK